MCVSIVHHGGWYMVCSTGRPVAGVESPVVDERYQGINDQREVICLHPAVSDPFKCFGQLV